MSTLAWSDPHWTALDQLSLSLFTLSPTEPLSAVVTRGAARERRARVVRHRVLVGQSGVVGPEVHLVYGHTDGDAGYQDSQPGDLSPQTGYLSLHIDSFLSSESS